MKQTQELVCTVRKINRYERRIGAYDTMRGKNRCKQRFRSNEDSNIIKYEAPVRIMNNNIIKYESSRTNHG